MIIFMIFLLDHPRKSIDVLDSFRFIKSDEQQSMSYVKINRFELYPKIF